jgi:hypothetical protein
VSAKRFVMMPERAIVWLGQPFYERLLGTEMFRVLQEEEHRTVGEWRQFVCTVLGVPGTDRKRVLGALDGLLAAGLVLVGDSTVRLLYGEDSFRAAHGLPVRGATVEASAAAPSDALVRRERDRLRQQRSRDRRRDVTRDSHAEGRDSHTEDGVTANVTVTRDSHVGGVRGGSEFSVSSLSSPSVSPSPLGSSPQLAGCNAGAGARDGDEQPNPSRFRFELEELVRGEFFERNVTPQKAPASQWRDGCQTVADALQLGAYPDARAAMRAFATALVDACAGGKPLGLALQQTPLGDQLKPVAPRRQLSELAMRRLAEGT